MGDPWPGSWGFWDSEPLALGSPDLNVSDLIPEAGLPAQALIAGEAVLSRIGSGLRCEPVEGGGLTKMPTAAPSADVSVFIPVPCGCL